MPSIRCCRKYDEFTARADRQLAELKRTDAGRAAARRLAARERSPVRGRLKRAALIFVATIVAALLFGIFIGPIGIDGLVLLILALAVALGTALFWPARREAEPTTDTIRNAELGALPVRVERWLARRRGELPASAGVQIDELLLRLEVLAPQLERVDPAAPVVTDARRLIGDELPRLVQSYVDVPASYRGQGSEPERQLHEGLATISAELRRLSEQLAKGDLDRLAIEGRFLEIKYREGVEGEAPPAAE